MSAAQAHRASDDPGGDEHAASEPNEQILERSPGHADLEPLERAILDLEKQRFKYQGAKERAIRLQLRMPVTEYYQRLNALLDTRAAWAAEPVLVRWLVQLRDA